MVLTRITIIYVLLLGVFSSCTKKEPINKADNIKPAPKVKPVKKEPVKKVVVKKETVKKEPVKKTVEKKVHEKKWWEGEVTKLPPEKQKIFDTLKGRPLTKKFKRVDNEHYYKGNETRYDLWYKYIKDLGGAYVGVGPDQNYSFIGKAKSRLVVLMDYDIQVLATHRLYMLLIKKAKKPMDVYKWLGRRYKKMVAKWADAEYSKFNARWVKVIHRGAGEFIRKHHKWRLKQAKKKGIQYWLTDNDSFNHWKKLIENNCVKLVLGDLREGITMTEIANVLTKMKIPVRVQYFSNAEEFWFYTKGFRKSVLKMPYDDKTIILRSVVLGPKYKIGFKFHYTIQYAKDFREWMQWNGRATSKSIAKLHRIPLEGTKYLSRLPGLPDDAKKDNKDKKDTQNK